MEDKDRGPDKAGLKKLCTMAKAILPPPSKSTPDNDVEMHNLQSDTPPHASTETASASDINYYVEKEKTSAPTTGKHSVLSKRRTRQISPPVGTAVESKQSPENVAAASACPVDQRDNEENSSTNIQSDKKQPGKSINPIKAEVPNPIIESTAVENVEITAAGATAKFDVAVKSKKQITKKSVQNSQEMKSSSRSTGQKQQTVNQSITNTKPSMKSKLVSTTRSTKMTPNAPMKKKVGESNNKTGESIPQVTSIRRIERSTVVYKPKPVAAPNKHENSTRPNKKNKKSEIAPISASFTSGENSITSSSTDDDSGNSMEVQFSWDGASALVPATEDKPSNQSYKHEKSFVEKSLKGVKDFDLSSKGKKLAESADALLSPEYEAIKTPIEPFLTEEDISDIVSTSKKTPKTREKYISRRDSVFTIDANWATAPNVVFDIEHQKIRPETSPGRIYVSTDSYKDLRKDLPSKLLPSNTTPDDNQNQERKRSPRSADWRSHDSAYAEAPELYDLVVLEPFTPPNESKTDFEIIPEEATPQSADDTTPDFKKAENPEELPSIQVPNRNSVCDPEPHSPNADDPAMGNLPSASGDSSPEHRPQRSKDLAEPAKDTQGTKTTLRRRGSAKQEEINQYLDNLEDETASPTRPISPGNFWNFFQLFGSVLNIFRPSKQGKSETSRVENDQQTDVILDGGGGDGHIENGSPEQNISDEEDKRNLKNKKDTLDSTENGISNENGNDKENINDRQQGSKERWNAAAEQPQKYPYKDLFTCYTDKIYWFGICPNKVDLKGISKFLFRIVQVSAIITTLLSLADSLTNIKIYATIFFQNGWDIQELVRLIFFIMYACIKGFFLFLVAFRWDTLIAFLPIHHDIMNKCCDAETLRSQTENNEFIGNCMSAGTMVMSLIYGMVSKFDLRNPISLERNLRINAAATDVLVYMWETDVNGNKTNLFWDYHVNDQPMSAETAYKGFLGEGMEYSGEAHDEFMLDIIFSIVFCLWLTTKMVVRILQKAVPVGADPEEYTNWQWMIYGLLRLMTETINATFSVLWALMHYTNLLRMANFCFQMVWEPAKVMWWFQGSSIAKLGGIYYFGVEISSQNKHIDDWVAGICSGKAEIELGGEIHNVIVLINDVSKHPIGFGSGRSFINTEFVYGVFEKIGSFFLMLASFRQKPCECKEICAALVKALVDQLKKMQ